MLILKKDCEAAKSLHQGGLMELAFVVGMVIGAIVALSFGIALGVCLVAGPVPKFVLENGPQERGVISLKNEMVLGGKELGPDLPEKTLQFFLSGSQCQMLVLDNEKLVFVNAKRLAKGERIVLSEGDRLFVGSRQIRFVA